MNARRCQACGRPLPLGVRAWRKYCEHGCLALICPDCGATKTRYRERCRSCAAKHRWNPSGGPVWLSPRERAVLELVAQGLANGQIGRQLYISPKTVEIHLYRACDKLGVHGRAAVVAEAIRRGLIT